MSRHVCGACGELDAESDRCACHEAATFTPCPDYTPGQSHPGCPKCGGFGAVVAPAPLAAAIEEARKSMAEYETLCPMGVRTGSLLYGALRSLLLALDAVGCVPGVICPTCLSLDKAESALREIRTRCTADTRVMRAPHRTVDAVYHVSNDYFAEKGEVNG